MKNIARNVWRMAKRIIYKTGSQVDFSSSASYWEDRYSRGGTSGVGSYGKLSRFKAGIINQFITDQAVGSVIELGCGDGNQLEQLEVKQYLGVDVSAEALDICRRRFSGDHGKRFALLSDLRNERADLTMSLDVIYHLVEQDAYEAHMLTLFEHADRWVIIYSSNFDGPDETGAPHVLHRKFDTWIDKHQPSWELCKHVPNDHPFQGDFREGSHSDFYIYEKVR